MESIVYHGRLLKRGQWNTSWQPRYFILYDSGRLTYHKEPSSSSSTTTPPSPLPATSTATSSLSPVTTARVLDTETAETPPLPAWLIDEALDQVQVASTRPSDVGDSAPSSTSRIERDDAVDAQSSSSSSSASTRKPKKTQRGALEVTNARLLELDHSDFEQDFAFAITPNLSQRTYVLAGYSMPERTEWILALQRCGGVVYWDQRRIVELSRIEGFRNPPETAPREYLGRLSSVTKSDPRSLREGFLSKQGGVIRSWRRRYFVLFPHTLRYYHKKGDVAWAGEIPLVAGASVAPAVSSNKKHPYVFQLNANSRKSRTFLLRSASDDERTRWIDDIAAVLKENQSSKRPSVSRSASEVRGGVGLRLVGYDDGDDSDTDQSGWSIHQRQQWEHRHTQVEVEQSEDFMDLFSSSSDEEYVESDSDSVGSLGDMDFGSTTPGTNSRHLIRRGSGLNIIAVREGYLHKRGQHNPLLKKRYFVLESGKTRRSLKYFRTDTDMKLIGAIPLLEAEVLLDEDRQFGEHVVTVRPKGSERLYVLHAETAEDAEAWQAAIASVVEGHPCALEHIKRAASTSVSSSGKRKTLVSTKSIQRSISTEWYVSPSSALEGWLARKGKAIVGSAFRMKYVIVSAGKLYYFTRKPMANDLNVNKAITLQGARVTALPGGDGDVGAHARFLFSVTPLSEDADAQTLIFGTDTQEGLSEWLEAFQDQINLADAKLHKDTMQLSSFLAVYDVGNPASEVGAPYVRRFVAVTDRTLVVYSAFAEVTELCAIPLDGTSVQSIETPDELAPSPYALSLVGDSGSAEWIFVADTEAERDEWFDCLS